MILFFLIWSSSLKAELWTHILEQHSDLSYMEDIRLCLQDI